MYFVVADFGLINTMYQFSLRYFTTLFKLTIENAPKSSDLEARLKTLLSETTKAVYMNVSRGLFEKDKLVFSFMLCGEILKLNRQITSKEWTYFLRGVPGMDKKRAPKPDRKWLSDTLWNNAVDLASNLDAFRTLTDEIIREPICVQLGDLVVWLNPSDQFSPKMDPFNYTKSMSEFERLTLIKNFAEDKVFFFYITLYFCCVTLYFLFLFLLDWNFVRF